MEKMGRGHVLEDWRFYERGSELLQIPREARGLMAHQQTKTSRLVLAPTGVWMDENSLFGRPHRMAKLANPSRRQEASKRQDPGCCLLSMVQAGCEKYFSEELNDNHTCVTRTLSGIARAQYNI